MPHELVERQAQKLIAEVRDDMLVESGHHFTGTWAVVQNNDIFAGLVAKLSDPEKDLLWKLVTDTVETTLGKLLLYLDHKHVTGEMRVVLRDPDTGEEIGLLDDRDLDLSNEYWFEWLPKYARVQQRPTAPPGQERT